MKLTTFLLLVACLQISAKGVSQQISLSEKKVPLKKILRQVARQAGISIVYDETLLAAALPVTIDVKNASVEEVLDICLENQPFDYAIDGARIIVKSIPVRRKVTADTTITVTGRVMDDNGEPVPGVSVRVKDGTAGTATDASGKFTLKAPPAATLVFSALGFAPYSQPVGNGNLTVRLKGSETALTETVVVGYGVQKKSVVTGAISSVKAADLENQPITRVESALQGRTSGVTIATSSGQPGAGSAVRVRGLTTFNNNDPLWVVDGVVVDNGGIGYLNQYDIESIEVLKDAASQAIYGARAAAGVILVTTKKGKAGKLSVNYNGYYGTSAPARKLKLLNATEYATLRNEAAAAIGDPLPYADPRSYGVGTDWQEQIFNNSAKRQNHEISVSGGNDRSTFYSSFGYLKQDGIVATDISKYERVNFRLNSTHKLSQWVTFGQNVGYAYDKSIGLGNTNSEFGGPLASAINLDPITPVVITDPAVAAGYNATTPKDANGNYYGISQAVAQEIINPLAYIKTRLGNYGWSHNIVGNAYLEVSPIKGLKLRSTLGSKISFWGSESFTPIAYLNPSTIFSRTSFNRGSNSGYNWNLENTVSYNREFNKHNITLLAGQGAYLDNRTRALNVTYFDLPVDNFKDASLNYNVAQNQRNAGGSENPDHRISSLFARVNYAYDEKYLAEAIIRRDGSSRFGSNNKYGVFPSFSLGWVASREGFWADNDVVNFLKLRGGYGVVGNDNIGDFAYLATIGGGRNYSFGNEDTYLIGYSPNAPSNPDLKWESTSQTNIGFEATVLRNITVSFDWFRKATKDILQYPRIPLYVGAISNPAANVADMENTGVELELGFRKKFGEVDFSVNGNVSYLKNKVTNLGQGVAYLSGGQTIQSTSYPITRTAIGQPFSSFYGFKTNGIFQTQQDVDAYVNKEGKKLQPGAVAGDFRWVDVNGDGQITDEGDRTFLGNPTPTLTYGFTLNSGYKGFDVVLFVQGAAGNKIFQGLRRLDIPAANWQTKALGRWTGAGTSNDYPRLSLEDNNKNFTNPSDFYLEDGSYCRIKTLQIGYSLPSSLVKKAHIERFRVYLVSENLLTLTKYTGYDPEIGGGVFSIDRGIYPQARSFMVGVNATF
ncbi:TonB-dependent receptor [Chitinophaga rhizophila]|uniref:TonB-dependent receptor n=1 Tax=Chitinophaga rhizophila TaxID=2866212 RepID=A0ABS7GEL7_9BACT|nr:TonB-dependent receptor [Chitinophaga rhizophila]MBW8685259.1 TonB-dependent receptor [Chitinophaga rhizophila]